MDLDDGAGELLLLAGEHLYVGLVVLPQAQAVLLGELLSGTQLVGA